MILLCYDGSTDSQAAIDRAGELFSGQPATVLTVWERFIDVMALTGAGLIMAPDMANIEQIDAASEEAARTTAEEGVERARRAGLNAQPHTRARVTSVPAAILSEAEDVGADAIVMGTRGLSGVKSLFLGSVSNRVLHEADIPVVVVPSPEVAAERSAHRR